MSNLATLKRGSLPKYDAGEIRRMFLEHRSQVTESTPLVREIASTIGCGERTVYRALSAEPRLIPRRAPSFTPEQEAFIVRLLEDGCPYTEVAKTLGTTPYIIEYRWPGHGIQTATERLIYARAVRDFERWVQRLGLDEREER